MQGRARSSIYHHCFNPRARSSQYYDAPVLPFLRAFTTSSVILKGGGKQNSKRNAETASAKVSALRHDDPYDLSDLESRLAQILSRLGNDLAELRSGGRFNPKAIEDLRVRLAKGNRDTERLGDLAQVVPKGGRSIVIYIGEEAVRFHSNILQHRT